MPDNMYPASLKHIPIFKLRVAVSSDCMKRPPAVFVKAVVSFNNPTVPLIGVSVVQPSFQHPETRL